MYEIMEKIVEEFRGDPRNKVFASEALMIASVSEETGQSIDAAKLRGLVKSYQDGGLNEQDQDLFDAAMYACSSLAKACFADDPEDEDEEVDFAVDFIENTDGSVSAEVRPA